MNISTHAHLPTVVAALCIGGFAMMPVQPPPNHIVVTPQHAVNTLSVELAAAIDPITTWIEALQDASANIQLLLQNWQKGLYVDGIIPAPSNTTNGNLGNRTGGYESGERYPFILQVLENQKSYLAQLPDIGGIIKQMVGNIRNAVTSPFTSGETLPGSFLGIPGRYNQNVDGVVFDTAIPGPPINQRTVLALLPILAPVIVTALKPILNFATTPISGVLLGVIGPVLGPVLSAVDSVRAIFTAVEDREWTTAINETLNIPAHMFNAFLNGGPTLDLTKILGSVLPDSIKAIGVKMGGLLSPGGVAADGITATAGATLPIVGPISLEVPGNAVGPLGAFSGLTNYIAKSIRPPQAPVEPGATRRPKAAASDGALAPKQLRRAERKAAGSAGSGRAPRSAAARHAG